MLSQKMIKMIGMGILRDKAGDPPAGGGTPPAGTPPATPPEDVAALKAKLAAYEQKEKESSTELVDKAKAIREETDKKKSDYKALESAITFNTQGKDFLKTHESILPKEAADIFAAAEKETYDSPVQKASNIKSGIITEFFKVQANLDLLTPTHKQTLDGFLKLTKNGKEEKAQEIYENIFEPAIEMMKRIKKAEEVNRSQNGLGNLTDQEAAYTKRMRELSEKHYLGEKK
jgi:hypothetical protein